MTKEMIRAKASDIRMMDEKELLIFGVAVDMSDIDPKSKAYLYMALDDRRLQLMEEKELQGTNVIMSEVKDGELL